MPKIIKNNTVYAAVPSSANGIAYDGSSSGISSNTVQGAIDEVANDKNIASVFDSTATYNENDYVIYSGALYRAKNAVSAGFWSGSTDWESVTVGEELNNKPFVIVCTQTQFDTWDNSSFPLLNCEYLITDSTDVSLDIGDLSDVTTTGASTGDVLVKGVSGWASQAPTYAKKTWTLIGTLSEGGTGVSVSAYSELLVYLKINNTTYYNPHLIDVAEFSNTSTIFLTLYQDSTHTYVGGIDYSNGTITWRKVLIAGWTNCYLIVKAR